MVQNSNTGNRGFLGDAANEDGLYPIWGIALGNNDITVGQKSGEPKLWRPEVLEEAADTLEGRDIVVNHENRDAYEVIGEVSEAKFTESEGVLYKGMIDSAELARKIEHGWLEVSPRIIHSKAHEMVQEVKVPDSIRKFDNLSIVRKGAAGSNEVNLGEAEELSVEELQESFETDEDKDVVEYQQLIDTSEVEELQGEIDFAQYLYDDPQAATGASQQFKCESFHTHQIQGKTWYSPCDTHDKLVESIKQEGGADSDDMADSTEEKLGWSSDYDRIVELSKDGVVEELQLSEARTPTYDETETKSWGDIPADTLSYFVDALEYDDVEQVDDLSQSQKEEIASHSLLGDPQGDTVREVRFFPVVNAESGDLNRGALEAVRSGRGQSADIPESAYDSAFAEAGRLLNEEFDADVEEEMAKHLESIDRSKEEMRIASQLASHSSLTKDEGLSMLDVLKPDRPTDVVLMADIFEKILGDEERSELISQMEGGKQDSILNDMI